MRYFNSLKLIEFSEDKETKRYVNCLYFFETLMLELDPTNTNTTKSVLWIMDDSLLAGFHLVESSRWQENRISLKSIKINALQFKNLETDEIFELTINSTKDFMFINDSVNLKFRHHFQKSRFKVEVQGNLKNTGEISNIEAEVNSKEIIPIGIRFSGTMALESKPSAHSPFVHDISIV